MEARAKLIEAAVPPSPLAQKQSLVLCANARLVTEPFLGRTSAGSTPLSKD